MNVLHITSHLSFAGSNKELAALAIDQQAGGHCVRVCCLSSRGPWTHRLEASGISVRILGWTRWFDVTPPWQLRELLGHADVEAVQVWGPTALRWVGLLRPALLPRVIFSPPLPHERRPLDRWLLGRAGRVVVRDESEKTRALALGARPESTVVVPPGVSEVAAGVPVPREATSVVGIGPLEKEKNFRVAVWAMDMLTEVFPTMELDLVGRGSQREALIDFSSRFERKSLRLAGERDDVAAHLTGAALCWLPAADGCRHAALEALAAGRPVVASDLPHLREIIPDGEAGFLIPAGEKVPLARKTRTLVLDPELRQRMGEVGRRHVRERYPQEAFLQRWRDIVRKA